MRKSILIVSFIFINIYYLTAQEDLNLKFKNFIYNSLDSFKYVNKIKHDQILGITLVAKLNGDLDRYKLRFKSKEIRLTKKEYRWLFRLLCEENYKKYINIFIREEEIDGLKELKYGIIYKRIPAPR